MPKINRLPKNIAELIAAGEVVERPASVTKELIENSIDAKADRITLEIKNGGIKYIRITDNGCGIPREDVKTAFLSHATSKIQTKDDLDAIFTLGFRGEALASIAAVSRVEILTRDKEEAIGTRYCIEGGEEALIDDAGCPEGSTIIVRDLFFNTPARQKFLKKDTTEGNYVSDIITKLALSNPHISFRLIKEDKQVIFTPGDGKLLSAIYALFGKDFSDNLFECNYELNGIRIKGYISSPLSSRPNRNMQYFFVNGRYIKMPTGAVALDEAYRNSIMVGKFPSCVLCLQIPPETVDVNVHPAKTQVRFSDEKRIFELIYYGVKNTLATKDSRPQISINPKIKANPYNADDNEKGNEKKDIQLNLSHLEKPSTAVMNEADVKLADNSFRKSKSYEAQNVIDENLNTPVLRDESIAVDYATDVKEIIPVNIKSNNDKDIFQADNNEFALYDNIGNDFRIIGEVFKTYILVESNKKLLFIDKHAAHERMIYERLRSGKKQNASQLLMFSVAVTLSKREYSAVLDNLSLLREAGFVVEDFGEGTVLVRECPVELGESDVKSLIEELAGYLISEIKELIPEKLDWLYHSAACRAAIKAGSKTSEYEMQSFIKMLLKNDEIKYCPHGRPVMFEMSKYELEKLFGR